MTKDTNVACCFASVFRRCAARGAAAQLALLASAVLALSCDPPGTIRVTNPLDGQPGSLRAAIDAANRSTSAVRVELPAGTYELTRCSADDTNRGGDLDVTTDAVVSLVALDGAVVVIRQTCAEERVLDALGAGRLTLSGVTITGGSISGPTEPARGAGVRARGDVELERATITGNTARIFAEGAGLYVGGALTSHDSAITGNTATGGASEIGATPLHCCGGSVEGGGAFVVGAISLTGGVVSDNTALGVVGGHARGGGIAQAGESVGVVMLSGVTFSGNTAQGGIGPLLDGTAHTGGSAMGGALSATGRMTAVNVTAIGNRALGGTALFLDPVVSHGRNSGAATGGALAASRTFELTTSTFSGNLARSGDAFVAQNLTGFPAGAARGGAVWANWKLTVSDCTFSENQARQGGGFPPPLFPYSGGGAVYGAGELTINGGRYTHNASSTSGGAVNGVAVSIVDVTFISNTADATGPSVLGGYYGDRAGGGAVDATTLTATRLTATGNVVNGNGGGAVRVYGDATIDETVIRNNRVNYTRVYRDPAQGAGGGVHVGGKLVLSNSLLEGNGGWSTGAVSDLWCEGRCKTTFVGGGAWAGILEGRNVTFAGNYALGTSEIVRSTIYDSGGGALGAGTVKLVNATLTGNRVTTAPTTEFTGPGRGAAIFAHNMFLEHTTILENDGVAATEPATLETAARGPAASLYGYSLVTHRSVVVPASGADVCSSPTLVKTHTDSSYNWFADASCALAGVRDQQSTAGLSFAALADNGGLVHTRLPTAGSALVDYVPAGACPTATDARGVARPQGTACDVGAAEIVSFATSRLGSSL